MDTLKKEKRIAFVVDDNKRTQLIEWSYFNKEILSQHEIIANEPTADLLKGTLNVPITTLVGGTIDGYRQLTQMIEKSGIDILLFFGDHINVDIHQIGISDLLALAIEQDIMIACNLATADLIIGSLYKSSSNKQKISKTGSAKSRQPDTNDNGRCEISSFAG